MNWQDKGAWYRPSNDVEAEVSAPTFDGGDWLVEVRVYSSARSKRAAKREARRILNLARRGMRT